MKEHETKGGLTCAFGLVGAERDAYLELNERTRQRPFAEEEDEQRGRFNSCTHPGYSEVVGLLVVPNRPSQVVLQGQTQALRRWRREG